MMKLANGMKHDMGDDDVAHKNFRTRPMDDSNEDLPSKKVKVNHTSNTWAQAASYLKSDAFEKSVASLEEDAFDFIVPNEDPCNKIVTGFANVAKPSPERRIMDDGDNEQDSDPTISIEPTPWDQCNSNHKETELGQHLTEYLAAVDWGVAADDTAPSDPFASQFDSVQEKHASASIGHPKVAAKQMKASSIMNHCSDLSSNDLIPSVTPPQSVPSLAKVVSPPSISIDACTASRQESKVTSGSPTSLRHVSDDAKKRLSLSAFPIPTEVTLENDRIDLIPAPQPSYSPSETKRAPVASIADYHVLGGRKAAGSLHPANVEYLRIVGKHKQLYRSYGSQHGEKTRLRNIIVDELLDGGFRFIKGDGTGPTCLLTLQEIRIKVGQCLRENRDRKKQSNKKEKEA